MRRMSYKRRFSCEGWVINEGLHAKDELYKQVCMRRVNHTRRLACKRGCVRRLNTAVKINGGNNYLKYLKTKTSLLIIINL